MRSYWQNERGAATMIVEFVLLIAVLVVVGYAGLHVYRAHHTTATATTTIAPTSSPASSSSVDTTVNAIIQGTATESAAAVADDSETSQVTATANSESSVTGAYNESSF